MKRKAITIKNGNEKENVYRMGNRREKHERTEYEENHEKTKKGAGIMEDIRFGI